MGIAELGMRRFTFVVDELSKLGVAIRDESDQVESALRRSMEEVRVENPRITNTTTYSDVVLADGAAELVVPLDSHAGFVSAQAGAETALRGLQRYDELLDVARRQTGSDLFEALRTPVRDARRAITQMRDSAAWYQRRTNLSADLSRTAEGTWVPTRPQFAWTSRTADDVPSTRIIHYDPHDLWESATPEFAVPGPVRKHRFERAGAHAARSYRAELPTGRIDPATVPHLDEPAHRTLEDPMRVLGDLLEAGR